MTPQVELRNAVGGRGRVAIPALVALLTAAGTSRAQVPIAPAELAELRAAYLAAQQPTGEVQAGRQLIVQSVSGTLTHGRVVEQTDNPAFVYLYVGLQPTPPGNGFWLWTWGGSEVVYWALDDGKMGSGAAAAGGGHATEYEFSLGLHADFAGDILRPFVIVSFYHAPFDPIGQAINPVVEPPTPVSSVGWIFNPITLPAAGFYALRSGLVDLVAAGADFDLDETFYVEILPLEWSSYPNGAPVADPDVFAVFTGPGTVTYGVNQDHMWSDFWVHKGGCTSSHVVLSNADGYYNHPAEMDDGGCTPYLNQSGIILRGLECTPVNRLVLAISEPSGPCVKPGGTVTVTLSQSCLPGLVRGYQAFLSFSDSTLTFLAGSYTPAPYGLPIIDPIVAVGPDIDLAAGIDNGAGQQPTSTSADLVTLTFTAGPNDGLANVVFRGHDPPTRFSDEYGQPVTPALFNSPDVCVDGTPPIITCPPGPSLQCVADVPAPATDYAGFVAQGGTAVDNSCWGPVPPTVTHEGDTSNGGAGCPASPLIITRTYRATDCAGNYAECTQTITVIDDTPPTFTRPDDITRNADAGGCTLTLTAGEIGWPANLADNCTPSNNLVVGWVRSDGQPTLTAPFNSGKTTITWTVADACGNAAVQVQTITVNAFNELVVSLQLEWPFTGNRCVTFELWQCTPPTKVIESEVLAFSGGLASTTVLVDCGSYECITVRDRLHTLRRTLSSPAFKIVGTQYLADFAGAGKPLVGGNLNDDYWVDVLDFGVYTWKYGTKYRDGVEVPGPPLNGDTTCSSPYPHADISGNGIAWTEDFAFIQINFLKGHETNCCGQPGDGPGRGPTTVISVADLQAMGLEHLAASDLNEDGWLDLADMIEFMLGARPEAAARPDGQWQDSRSPVEEVEW